jgi:predicted ATPase
MIQRVLNQLWDQLRAKRSAFPEYLDEVRISNLRGISDLNVRFSYPVTVIAGPNGSGKSTVLFACACAYKVPLAKSRDFVPTTLFPNLKLKGHTELSDRLTRTAFDFQYTHFGRRSSSRWAKGKSWNRSGDEQPERAVYLRTLANLTSPGEVRSVLKIGQGSFTVTPVTSDLIAFAQKILPFRYQQVTLINKKNKDLLFANRSDGPQSSYSEFHMSAGERAILRISREVSNLKQAIVLIDEVEAGLHPFTQQQFMIELQRIALRNELQIIVTTHSPVILDSVPVEGRVFLDRTDGQVIIKQPWKDIIQKALYGQSQEKLSILCEDEIGEAMVVGAMDYLNPKVGLLPDDIKVGRDTGKFEFKNHIIALGKFNQLGSFLCVLDGDARPLENELKGAASKFGGFELSPLFLPGDVPEQWIWQVISTSMDDYASRFSVSRDELARMIANQNQLYDNATDKPAQIIKNKFSTFCDQLRRTVADVARLVTYTEAKRGIGDIKVFCDDLETQLRNWQNRR